MQRRNVTGSTILGNPWGLAEWATRVNVLLLGAGLVGLALALAGGAGWDAYLLFGTLRRGRH